MSLGRSSVDCKEAATMGAIAGWIAGSRRA